MPVPTRTGELLSVVVPIPSWPEKLSPHAQRVPSVFTNRTWEVPAANDFMAPLDPLVVALAMFDAADSPTELLTP